MNYERLTVPVSPRLKVSISTVSVAVYECDSIADIYGLDWIE